MRTLLHRLDVTPPDAALALAFALAGLAQVSLWPIADGGIGHLYVLGATLPLAWRRTRPVEATTISSAFGLIPIDGFPVLGFLVVLLLFYGLGMYGNPRLAVVLATGWGCVAGAIGTLLGPEPPVAVVGAVLVVTAPVLAGSVVRRLQEQNAELRRLTGELAAEREKVRAAAVGAERERIAQELHDVVGHELTLIAIQAEAAGVALRGGRPGRAAGPIDTVRDTAHRTLAEMRSVLDVLAGPAEEERHDVVELVRRAQEAGLDCRLELSGEPWPENAPVRLAANRVVQESLTNATRHASGHPVTVAVRWEPDVLVVGVRNPTDLQEPPAHTGRGLEGIRHRAELLGGRYALSIDDGYLTVRVDLPRRAAR